MQRQLAALYSWLPPIRILAIGSLRLFEPTQVYSVLCRYRKQLQSYSFLTLHSDNVGSMQNPDRNVFLMRNKYRRMLQGPDLSRFSEEQPNASMVISSRFCRPPTMSTKTYPRFYSPCSSVARIVALCLVKSRSEEYSANASYHVCEEPGRKTGL